MKISFCTTCKNRAHHLKQTLPQNLKDTVDLTRPNDFEFVVLNYSSEDDLENWIITEPTLKPYRDSGILMYARHDGQEKFRHSHAKNMAHRLASGDIVCNVDADNFVGKGFGAFLQDTFAKRPKALVCTNLTDNDLNLAPHIGCMGRIAMRKDCFLSIGGYSEAEGFRGWAGEDAELIIRATKNGYIPTLIQNKNYLHVIQHSNMDRLQHADCDDIQEGLKKIERLDGVSLSASFHKAAFLVRLLAQPLVANRGIDMGAGLVRTGFSMQHDQI